MEGTARWLIVLLYGHSGNVTGVWKFSASSHDRLTEFGFILLLNQQENQSIGNSFHLGDVRREETGDPRDSESSACAPAAARRTGRRGEADRAWRVTEFSRRRSEFKVLLLPAGPVAERKEQRRAQVRTDG